MIDSCRHFPIVKVMTDEKHITDEMLTRWLCGQSTPDEETAVLDYLAESDEHFNGLLTIASSVKIIKKEHTNRWVRPLWPTVSIAASVALLLGIGTALWHLSSGSTMGIDAAPAYATHDTIVEPIEDIL